MSTVGHRETSRQTVSVRVNGAIRSQPIRGNDEVPMGFLFPPINGQARQGLSGGNEPGIVLRTSMDDSYTTYLCQGGCCQDVVKRRSGQGIVLTDVRNDQGMCSNVSSVSSTRTLVGGGRPVPERSCWIALTTEKVPGEQARHRKWICQRGGATMSGGVSLATLIRVGGWSSIRGVLGTFWKVCILFTYVQG